MPTHPHAATARLLGFNQQMLDQARAVVEAHVGSGSPSLAGPVGAHLRHLIEHYEALVQGLQTGVVDYDRRPRDRLLETSPALAVHRLMALRRALGQWTPQALTRQVVVQGQGGTVGDFEFAVESSVGRELAFLASHAVHHFALLAPHLHRLGIPVPVHFGKAPGTVANEMATQRAACLPDTQETL